MLEPEPLETLPTFFVYGILTPFLATTFPHVLKVGRRRRLVSEWPILDDIVLATYVLAGVTGALVIVTALYAYYAKQQVKLLKIGHELAKKEIAVRALAAFSGISPALITKEKLDQKLRELGLEKQG